MDKPCNASVKVRTPQQITLKFRADIGEKPEPDSLYPTPVPLLSEVYKILRDNEQEQNNCSQASIDN